MDRDERLTRRYLDLLRDALLDEHYLENELRIAHLLDASAGTVPEAARLADPGRYLNNALRDLRQERAAGEPPDGEPKVTRTTSLAHAPFGRARLEHLEECLDAIRRDGVEGDLVDYGSKRVGAGIFMRAHLEVHRQPDSRVWMADRFDGSADGGASGPLEPASDLNAAREAFARFRLLDDRVRFRQGPPARAFADAGVDRIALLRVDGSDPEDVRETLEALHDRVSPGGFVIIDDYGAPDVQVAVDRFREQHGLAEPLVRIDWSGAVWRKPHGAPASDEELAVDAVPATAPKDLSVVVVVHDMRRESARTLHSLSRAYQRGVEDLDYEVIVVENGSAPDEQLGEDLVRSFGPEFQYIDLGEESTPSPARAVNRGIAASSGKTVALMIDGAHVLTPGVLRLGMLGLATYAPAVAIAKQWYVGPGQQPQMVAQGYDQELEDRLFEQIDWPTDGYRLFQVGHFIGSRDWFDGEWESNCLFVPRMLLEQVGGMDESFSVPGGGFVNLDFFERLIGSPGVTLVTMLGEGSFHQVHGGTTTNRAEAEERRDLIRSYGDEYADVRGRRFQIPNQRAHYVGSLPPSARRTRARRMGSEWFRGAYVPAADRRPAKPAPIPEELRSDFIDAFWRSGASHRTTWLGVGTHRPPTDLFAYQELIHRLRPAWILETRTGAGGRALFMATTCDLIDHGRVLSIDSHPVGERPEHPRITYLRGDPTDDGTAAQAREIVGDQPSAMVILGAAARPQLAVAFEQYAQLIPVGSYLVVEETILEGNPVWPGFGAGPWGLAQQIADEGEFTPDPTLERWGLTFSPGGFLKRVRGPAP